MTTATSQGEAHEVAKENKKAIQARNLRTGVLFTAPALIRDVAAAIGGSGGGRPDQAQAGGSNVEGIDEAFRILKQKIAG